MKHFVRNLKIPVFALLIWLLFCQSTVKAEGVTVMEGANMLKFANPVYLIEGTSYMEGRDVLQYLGMEVKEDPLRIIGFEGNTTVILPVNQSKIYINNEYADIGKPIVEIGGKKYVPLAEMMKLAGVEFGYDAKGQQIHLRKGMEPIVAIKNSGRLKKVGAIHLIDTSTTYKLESIKKDILTLYSNYGNLVTYESIGKSVEGRDIYAVKVGVEQKADKPCILLVGGIHAREDFSVMYVMQELNHILYHSVDKTWGDYNIEDILNKMDIYFIPTINPDGLNIVQNGLWASSNYAYLKTIPDRAGSYQWWKANARGVDLNANFNDGNWEVKFLPGQSSRVPASEGFKGFEPESEPETQVLMNYCDRKKFTMAISYHTSGEVFYWADTDTHDVFRGMDTGLISRMAGLTGYFPMPVSTDPAVFGSGFENWFKKRYNRFAMCLELSPLYRDPYQQYPDYRFNELVWEKAKYTGIQLAVEAIYIQDKMYNVYQLDTYLKSFYDYNEAVEYARLWQQSRVERDKKILWYSMD